MNSRASYFDGERFRSETTRADVLHRLMNDVSTPDKKTLVWTRYLHVHDDGTEEWFAKPTNIRTLRVQLWRADRSVLVEETLVYLRSNLMDHNGKRPFLVIPPRGQRWALVGYIEDISSVWRRPHSGALPCRE